MVHGATPQERAAARTRRTKKRRAEYYVELMTAATGPADRLRHACDFLRAVAKDLPPDDVNRLAADVTRIADERNLR